MPDKRNLQPLLDVQINELNLVFGDSDAVDTKALAILGANLALMIFVDQAAKGPSGWLQNLIIWTPLAISLLLDIVATWPRRYISAPEIDDHSEYLSMDEETLQLQLIADIRYAITCNTKINHKRLRACLASLLITGLSIALVLVILRA